MGVLESRIHARGAGGWECCLSWVGDEITPISHMQLPRCNYRIAPISRLNGHCGKRDPDSIRNDVQFQMFGNMHPVLSCRKYRPAFLSKEGCLIIYTTRWALIGTILSVIGAPWHAAQLHQWHRTQMTIPNPTTNNVVPIATATVLYSCCSSIGTVSMNSCVSGERIRKILSPVRVVILWR